MVNNPQLPISGNYLLWVDLISHAFSLCSACVTGFGASLVWNQMRGEHASNRINMSKTKEKYCQAYYISKLRQPVRFQPSMNHIDSEVSHIDFSREFLSFRIGCTYVQRCDPNPQRLTPSTLCDIWDGFPIFFPTPKSVLASVIVTGLWIR